MSNPLSVSFDLSGVKTTVPLIKDKTNVRLRLKDVKEEQKEKGAVLTWEWNLVAPAPIEGEPDKFIQPGEFGSTIFETIPLYAKPDAKRPTWFLEKIARRVDALLGTGDAGNSKGKPERPPLTQETVASLIGKEIVALMKVRREDGYVGNDIDRSEFPADVPAAK